MRLISLLFASFAITAFVWVSSAPAASAPANSSQEARESSARAARASSAKDTRGAKDSKDSKESKDAKDAKDGGDKPAPKKRPPKKSAAPEDIPSKKVSSQKEDSREAAKEASKDAPPRKRSKKKAAPPAESAVKEADKGGAADAVHKDTPGTLVEQLGLTVRTIMLDPGHGGKDPGAMVKGIVEQEFALRIAKKVGALLSKQGFTVLYTRTGNRYIALEDRVQAANTKKADLFISLHLNANPDKNIHGFEVYYLDAARSAGAATVAARENSVSSKKISDLQYILADFMLSAKLEESRDLAGCVRKGVMDQVRKGGFTFHDNGTRSAPFHVLMGARMPAILVECAYMTNAKDAANLLSDKFLDHQAEGLVNGLLLYKAKLARFSQNP